VLSRQTSGLDKQHAVLVQIGRYLRAAGYEFTTITPASHARVNQRVKNRWARDLRDIFGWSRLFKEETLPATLFGAMRDVGIVELRQDGWISQVRFSTLEGELLVHSAFPTTAENAVFFGPDTYKFVDAIRQLLAEPAPLPSTVADICAGSGAGALVIAKAAPQARVFSIDINPDALRLARVNAELAGVTNLEPQDSDLLSGVAGTFDLVVAHPPYLVDRGRRAYRHGGGPLGADLPLAVIRSALPRLAPNGRFLLFTGVAIQQGGDGFHQEASKILEPFGAQWSYREVDPDVFGEELDHPPYDEVDRIALKVLTVTRNAA
jgi:methylase of polypeptide subunit release factors